VVFLADDVGEEFFAVAFLDEADGDAGDGAEDGDAGVGRARVPEQTEAMEEEPLDSMTSQTRRTT
jgi:hypothetical protein